MVGESRIQMNHHLPPSLPTIPHLSYNRRLTSYYKCRSWSSQRPGCWLPSWIILPLGHVASHGSNLCGDFWTCGAPKGNLGLIVPLGQLLWAPRFWSLSGLNGFSSKLPTGAPHPEKFPFLLASSDVKATTGSLDLVVTGKVVNFSCLKLEVLFQFSLVPTL